MSGMAISVKAKNVEAFEKRLYKAAGQLRDPTPANREVSVQLYGWVIRNFDRGGALVGGWQPLAPATVREKAKLGKERMLVRSGHLRQSMLPFYSRENAGIGSELDYSKYHNEGVPKRHLPKRQLLPDRPTVLQIGLKVYNYYVGKVTAEANR